jgi:hypothetical protein
VHRLAEVHANDRASHEAGPPASSAPCSSSTAASTARLSPTADPACRSSCWALAPRSRPGGGPGAYRQGHRPRPPASKSWTVNLAWCHAVAIATDLLSWLKLLGCLDLPALNKAEPATCATGCCTYPPDWYACPHPLATRASHLALGQRTHPGARPRSDPAHPEPWLTSTTLP